MVQSQSLSCTQIIEKRMFFSDNLINHLPFLCTYAFIGAGFKYIDQVYDIGLFNKKIAWFLVVLVGVAMGILMAFDSYSTELLLSIILGISITSKLDNWAFRLLIIIALIVPGIYTVLQLEPLELHVRWVVLAILTSTAVLDEFFDYIYHQTDIKILKYRLLLDIVVFSMACLGFLPFVYFGAILSFDLAYLCVGAISSKINSTNSLI
jgi:hypothetical protein